MNKTITEGKWKTTNMESKAYSTGTRWHKLHITGEDPQGRLHLDAENTRNGWEEVFIKTRGVSFIPKFPRDTHHRGGHGVSPSIGWE
jgi:hypothetical protein